MTEFFKHIDKLVSQSEVVIERAKNSAHHVWKCVYPVDYGYLKGTTSTDGECVDVWVGSCGKSVNGVICTVDIVKRNCEMKVLLGTTESEMQAILEFCNATDGMKGILVRRCD